MAKRRATDDLRMKLDRVRDPAAAGPLIASALATGEATAVARAAELVKEQKLRGHEPALVATFGRFLVPVEDEEPTPAAPDPQCRAKTAIVEALATLEYRNSDFFLTYIGLTQVEWDWTRKPTDHAAHLRGLCGWGLVRSGHIAPLPHLVELLADSETLARRGAVQALAMTGREAAALLLLFKLLSGDPQPEVIGDACEALLALTPIEGVPFVARLLDAADEAVRLEAAAALGGSDRPEAFVALRDRWAGSRDEEFRESLLLAIGASRRPEAIEFLMSLLATGPIREAAQALAALRPCRFYPDLCDRIATTVAGRESETLTRQFRRSF